jgi:hypothetical protein
MLCAFCGMKGAIHVVEAIVDGKQYRWDACTRCKEMHDDGQLDVRKFLHLTVGRIVGIPAKCYLTGKDCLCYCPCCAGFCTRQQSHPVSEDHNRLSVRCQSGTRMERHRIGIEGDIKMTLTETTDGHDCTLTGQVCACSCRCCNGKCWSDEHPIDANHNKFEVACARIVDATLVESTHRNPNTKPNAKS